jgi:hypothetical protein
MMLNRATILLLCILWCAAQVCVAQSKTTTPAPAAKDATGFTMYEEFDSTFNTDGQDYELGSSVGYNFNKHFGVGLGIPIYFVRPSASSGGTSSNGIGNPAASFHLLFPNRTLSFGSTVTASAPVGDVSKGFSTGHATYDWTNHVDHAFDSLTPFADLGIANTITDTRLFMRPFTTYGFNTHFQGGLNYDLWKFFSVGAAGYDIIPSGTQTVFSKVSRGAGNGGSVSHGRVFQNNQQTTGSADIARDNGFSTYLDANPSGAVDFELGFTRSLHYALNSVSFSIGVNPMKLARKNSK